MKEPTLRRFLITVAIAVILAAPDASARSGGSPSPAHSGHSAHSKAAPGVERDAHGHVARSGHAKGDFRKSHPCPATGNTSGKCPGHVIDHVTPLKRGGVDAPSNMQWQSTEEATRKDKWE
jgi:hypothetical protein